VSANVPVLLTALMPVNSRLEHLCTKNIQSAMNFLKMNMTYWI